MNDPRPFYDESALHAPLSPDGTKRRDQMLAELVVEMGSHHRRKRIFRNAAMVAVIVLLSAVGVLTVLSGFGRGAQPELANNNNHVDRIGMENDGVDDRTGGIAKDPPPRIMRVRSDHGAAERYRAARVFITTVRLSDDELIEALKQIDRPAGLIRIGDEVRLSNAVTDAELNRAPGSDSRLPDALGTIVLSAAIGREMGAACS